jgi:peptidyl-prolyl cis-trans isomerase C
MLNVKHTILTTAIILLLVSPLCATERVVVEVNGVPITEAEVERQIERELPNVMYHRNVTPERRQRYRDKAIEDLIIMELFYQAAKERGIEANGSKVDEVYEFYKKRYGGEEKLKKALERVSLGIEDFKREIEKALVVGRFKKIYIEDKAKVSDKELKEYYEENKENFREPDKVKLREIFIAVPYDADYETIQKKKARALEVLKKVEAGEDFANLAWNYSEDPYAVKGGDIGYVHRGRLDPAIEEVAFRLKKGQTSGLIEVKAGYFIIKVEDIVKSKLLEFDEIKDKLRRDLEARRRREIKEELIKTLKEKAIIKKFE